MRRPPQTLSYVTKEARRFLPPTTQASGWRCASSTSAIKNQNCTAHGRTGASSGCLERSSKSWIRFLSAAYSISTLRCVNFDSGTTRLARINTCLVAHRQKSGRGAMFMPMAVGDSFHLLVLRKHGQCALRSCLCAHDNSLAFARRVVLFLAGVECALRTMACDTASFLWPPSRRACALQPHCAQARVGGTRDHSPQSVDAGRGLSAHRGDIQSPACGQALHDGEQVVCGRLGAAASG